jgi:hypothetical protein
VGFAQVPHDLMTHRDVRPPYIALYAALFFRVDNYQAVPPAGTASWQQLMRASGIGDVKTSRAAMAWLERHGFVRVTDRKGGRIGLRYELHPKGSHIPVPQANQSPAPQADRFPVPQPDQLPAPEVHPQPEPQGCRHPAPTPESPSEEETPPEGWGVVAALLEGRGVDLSAVNGTVPALVDQLVAEGRWGAAQLVDAVLDIGGLSLADRTKVVVPGALLATRLRNLGPSPAATAAARRSAELKRPTPSELSVLAVQDVRASDAAAQAVWEAAPEAVRERALQQARAELINPTASAVLRLARALAMEETDDPDRTRAGGDVPAATPTAEGATVPG